MSTTDSDYRGPFKIVFDGGSRGNPGPGYGSFVILHDGAEVLRKRLTYDHISLRITNNQAEYRTLIGALQTLLELRGSEARSTYVSVFGDSMLVIMQLLGQWKVKNPDLRPLYEEAIKLIAQFAFVDLTWHERNESFLLLGH